MFHSPRNLGDKCSEFFFHKSICFLSQSFDMLTDIYFSLLGYFPSDEENLSNLKIWDVQNELSIKIQHKYAQAFGEKVLIS